MITKPMLAVAVEDLETLKFPVLCTPKLDGIRCLVVDGKALSRKFKPIPNAHICEQISALCPDGFDGEIMIPGKDFNTVQSLVMSHEGTPQFEYRVFDWVSMGLSESYDSRMHKLKRATDLPAFVRLVTPVPIHNLDELMTLEGHCLELGYEGVMIRAIHGPYKCGRSTLKEGYLLKLKRFEDSEAAVIGFQEQIKNDNVLSRNELGYAKRSTVKAGMVSAGTLGALLVKDLKTNVEFAIGTGLDAAMRADIWANREVFLSKILTYKFQPSGMKDKPRFPVFKGFRSADDMGE